MERRFKGISVTVHLKLGSSLDYLHTVATMVLFVQLKNYFAVLNIRPNQTRFVNAKSVLALFLLFYCSGATTAQVLFENNSLTELGNTFSFAITFALNFVTLYSNVLRQAKIFGFIDKLEAVIENSMIHIEQMN